MAIFFTIKNHLCAEQLRRRRLRHKIHAIKTRPNKPLRFLQRKNSIPRYLANALTCAARKTTFRTRKRFHNKQYTSKSKDQPFESERTHFYVRFNKINVAMHRQTFIFLLSHKITTVQSKTAEINNHTNQPQNQSGNTITTNNHSTKYYVLPKTTILSISRENNHDNQSPAFAKQKHAQNKPNKQPTQSLDQKHPKTNTTSNYEKMQCF